MGLRRFQRMKMRAYQKESLEMKPLDLNAKSITENPDIFKFRRVVCRGVFDEKRTVFVDSSWNDRDGYYLITPLLPVFGVPESVQSPVLVNRGWVPRNWKDKLLSSSDNVERNEEQAPLVSLVEVIGVVRGTKQARLAKWFYVDVPAIARALGLPENTTHIEVISPYPIPKEASTLIRANLEGNLLRAFMFTFMLIVLLY